ncbi:MAG: F0F1 ATP synthase subunit A [Flavobacteriales bacterium AspAUS03]
MPKRAILFSILLSLVYHWGYTQHESQDTEILGADKERFDPAKVIIEHISDSHEWYLWGDEDETVTIPLPVILWDDGLQIFMSSEFAHGKKVVQRSENFYKIYHDKIYKTNTSGDWSVDALGNPTNKKPLDFSMTKNVMVILLSALLLCVIFFHMAHSYKRHRMIWQLGKILEPLVLFVKDEVAIPNLGHKKYKYYLPLLLTIFFFILVNNLLGLLPGAPNVMGNMSVTLVLATITFLVVNFSTNKAYWKHIFWMPGIPVSVRFLLAPIELAGIFIRPLTLCIRLFANMTAGHIVILSFICLIFIFKSIFAAVFSIPFALFISLLEVLVAFLQAFIFTTLSALFIRMAVEDHEYEIH